MEFQRFFDLCGRSNFPEQYRGDLEAAWDELQRHRPGDSSKVDSVSNAEYLRCSALYSILTGDLSECYRSLDALHVLLDGLHPEWGLRCTIVRLLADYTRRYPPSLRFYHEQGKPMNVAMLSDISGPKDISFRLMDSIQRHYPRGSPHDQALCQVLSAILWFPMLSRKLNAELHPLFPGGLLHNTQTDPKSIIAKLAESLTRYRDLTRKAGAIRMATYLSRLLVELRISCQSSDWMASVNDLRTQYKEQSDLVGMANCKLIEGDALFGPSFTSPIALNMAIVDATSAIGEDSLWDPVELELKDDYSPRVNDCYDAALKLFRQASSKRGQAAVLLRQACCLHTEVRRLNRGDPARAAFISEADYLLEQAFGLFGKDQANCQIVKAHQILLSITKGHSSGLKAIARGIGKWAVQAMNENVGHFLGLLMARFARHEWCRFSRMDNAMIAWECAYEVFESIGDILPMFQTVVSRIWTQNEVFNVSAVRVQLKNALEMVDMVSDYYDRLVRNVPDKEADRTILLASKFKTLQSFEAKASSIFLRIDDQQLLGAWRSKFACIVEHDESFQLFTQRTKEKLDFLDASPGLALSRTRVEGSWKRKVASDALVSKFGHCRWAYYRALDEGDIIKAEASYSQFLKETENFEKGYARNGYRLLACESIGDYSKARDIINSMDDNALLEGRLEEYLRGIEVKLTFPGVADNALLFCLLGSDRNRAYRIVRLIEEISPDFFDARDGSALDFSFRLSYHGAIMSSNCHPEVAFRHLLEARQLIELRRQQTVDVDAQMGAFAPEWMGEVYLNLARICLHCSEAGVPLAVLNGYNHGHPQNISWEEHALLFVEENRARAVLEALQAQFSHDKAEDETAILLSDMIHKRRMLRTLLALKNPTSEQRREIRDLGKQIGELEAGPISSAATAFIDRANSVIAPSLLYQSIDDDSVVIEATFSIRGCIAFAVTRDGIQQIHQTSTSNIDIRRPVMQLMKNLSEMTGYVRKEEEQQKREFGILSDQISSTLLDPFKEIIERKKHIIFSTSDPLTAFPFSALSFNGQPLIMHAAVSQIPSLAVKYHVSQRGSGPISPTVSVFAKSPTGGPSEAMRDNEETNLHLAGIEAVNIARRFSTWPIEAKNVSRTDFCEHIKGKSSILHVGAHGDVNYRFPLLSSISIGEDFRVLDMAMIRSNTSLLVFAACLSGLGRATTGSEVLGFSHVVLGSGCQAYIGTLCKVSDLVSMLLMTAFYRTLKDKPHMPLAQILREAQIEILQFDAQRAEQYLDQLLDYTLLPDDDPKGPEEFVSNAHFTIWTVKVMLGELDWASPFFWAPFVLMGDGGFRFLPSDMSE